MCKHILYINISQMLLMYGLFTYMKGETWSHEQAKMAMGRYSHPMGRIWDIVT